MTEENPLFIGVSQCLLGEEVRYDGGHKREEYLVNTLGQYVTFIPICPEVEAGFGVPREPLQLEGDPLNPQVISHRTRRDLTKPLAEASANLVSHLAKTPLHGLILKKNSPSCGLQRVRVYQNSSRPGGKGVGLFAHGLLNALPLLPVEEEGGLKEPKGRENFIEKVFVYHRWMALRGDPSAKGLVGFHARHKFLIMAHSPVHMRRLGNLVGGMKKDQQPPWDEYGVVLMEAMSRIATAKKQVDVIQHMMGFLKNKMATDEKAEMMALLASYKEGQVPLLVPITLLNHYVRRYEVSYLSDQWYLQPHPAELALRNHA
ncbi:MAG: DUF523 and DUF1722 domain-containing protein [Magnetococcales bacterium]|nr:DUF523 and DUF1722 domain-containing protein [Magnetococcales bacterium]